MGILRGELLSRVIYLGWSYTLESYYVWIFICYHKEFQYLFEFF